MVIWWFKDTELQLNMVVSMICWDFSDFAALTEKNRGQSPLVSGERMSIDMWARGATAVLEECPWLALPFWINSRSRSSWVAGPRPKSGSVRKLESRSPENGVSRWSFWISLWHDISNRFLGIEAKNYKFSMFCQLCYPSVHAKNTNTTV